MSTRSESVAPARLVSTAMSGVILRRIIWNVVPVVLVVAALEMVLVGDDGLLERHQLKQRLFATQTKVQQLNTYNAGLRARIRNLQVDPSTVRRVAGERLLTAPAGSTIYRFDAPLDSR